MTEKLKRKTEIRAYMIEPFKLGVQIHARELGFSDSDFIIYLYNFWLEHTKNPLKEKGDVTKALYNAINEKKERGLDS